MPETSEGVWIRQVLVLMYSGWAWLWSRGLAVFYPVGLQKRRTLTFFFDLDVCPLTYDVIDYLMLAEIERQAQGCADFFVVVVPGRTGGLRRESAGYESVVDRDIRIWRLHHLVIPAFSLFPTCTGYMLCSDRRQATFIRALSAIRTFPRSYWPAFPIGLFRRPLLDAINSAGGVHSGLTPPAQAMNFVEQWLAPRVGTRKAVIITLREYGFEPERNSNIAIWREFAASLAPEEFVPIFVLDTSAALAPPPKELDGFLVFETAATNLPIRAALYEKAWLNVCLAHGPTLLFQYNNKARYLIFMPVGVSEQTDEECLRRNGFTLGCQPSFACEFQKWVWQAEDLSVIQQEFSDMHQRLLQLQAQG